MTQPADSARSAATRIITELRSQGHTAYLAGGCVRDALLGQDPKDYDVATDATPDRVQQLFPKSAAVGAAFGVVLVYCNATQGRPRWTTEVATFRAEGAYSDGRRPDEVRFTDAREDASRRDFTVNGLFAEPADEAADAKDDRIIDYVGGLDDLKAGVLRAIGDPADRFGEDYLRMLRAVRFAARLGFKIEPRTSAALRNHARYLGQISRERIGQEVLAMLNGPSPAGAIALLQQHKLDGPTLNEDPSACELKASTALRSTADVPTRLAAWLTDRHGRDGNPKPTVSRWRKALCMSNEHRDELNRRLDLMQTLEQWDEMSVAARKRLASKPGWEQGMVLWQALGRDADSLRQQVQTLADDGIGLEPAPFLKGEDLIELGLEPGPAFKALLDKAYDQQLEGALVNRQQAIMWVQDAARP